MIIIEQDPQHPDLVRINGIIFKADFFTAISHPDPNVLYRIISTEQGISLKAVSVSAYAPGIGQVYHSLN